MDNIASNMAAGVPAQADAIVASGDAMAAYSREFIDACSCLDRHALFEVRTKLGKMKDFSKKEFDLMLSDAVVTPPPVRPIREPSEPTDILGHLLNDHGNACRIRDMYGDDLRYCCQMNTWLVWDGMRWAVSDIGQSRQLAKQTMLEFFKRAAVSGNEACEKFARLSLNSRSITAMLVMLETDLPIRAEDLDVNPWLLNFTNGTVDLRTASLRPHDRTEFITKLVHYQFDPNAQCPIWESFLRWAMTKSESDESDRVDRMVDYLQRALGYSITGMTSEKAVFIPYGPEGNNGKSTMVTVVRQLVKEYAELIQVETLMTKQRDSTVQEDLAKLRGARFVQTSEAEEGQRLSQGTLKRITQGMGDITATRKYEHSITFAETHTLWIDTNRRPEIRDAEDRATFNRLHPIPFLNVIPDEDIDRELPKKMIQEGAGILAWLCRGASNWYQDQSLHRPQEVDDARAEWHESSDQISDFLEECTVRGSGEIRSAILYRAYSRWCEDSGQRSRLPQKKFIEKLKTHGFSVKHYNFGNVIPGLSLPLPPRSDPPFDSGQS